MLTNWLSSVQLDLLFVGNVVGHKDKVYIGNRLIVATTHYVLRLFVLLLPNHFSSRKCNDHTMSLSSIIKYVFKTSHIYSLITLSWRIKNLSHYKCILHIYLFNFLHIKRIISTCFRSLTSFNLTLNTFFLSSISSP